MIDVLPDHKSSCCGCGGCAQACPVNCITLEQDEEGFLYPQVDAERCIACGRCEAVCPVLLRQQADTVADAADSGRRTRAFGGYHMDPDVRQQSSSGGAFTLLADWALREGGVVYGCALDDHLVARHERVTDMADLGKLRRSKYVQSDTRGTYALVRKDLRDGLRVLFVGTPCQVAGLQAFLGRDYPNLLACDFVCHGVPSPKVFADYLQSVEAEHGSRVREYRFRTKEKGWKSRAFQLGTVTVLESGQRIEHAPAFHDSYMCGFSCDLFVRPICHECPFKELPRQAADITIGDFWGVDKHYPQLNDGHGTSLLLAHTQKGMDALAGADKTYLLEECDLSKATASNPMLVTSSAPGRQRAAFFQTYQTQGYEAAAKKFLTAPRWFLHKVMVVLNGSGIVAQALKFCIVGVSNFGISYLINMLTLLLLHPLDWQYDYMVANITGFLLSVLWSFYWNSRYVFGGEDKGKGFGWRALLRTYASYAFTGIILNNALSTLWIQVLHIPKWVAPILNLPISVPTNFLMSKLWAYRRDS